MLFAAVHESGVAHLRPHAISDLMPLLTRDLFRHALFAAAWSDLIEGGERIVHCALANVMATVPLPSALEFDPVTVLVFEIFSYFVGIVCLQLYKIFTH